MILIGVICGLLYRPLPEIGTSQEKVTLRKAILKKKIGDIENVSTLFPVYDTNIGSKYFLVLGSSMVLVWKVQPSKASSCHSQGLINVVIRENRSPQHVTHLPHVWDLLLA